MKNLSNSEIISNYEVVKTGRNTITIEADLFEVFEKCSDVVATHVANCWHTMGAGIARIIRKKYPSVYEADCRSEVGPSKLGTYSLAKVNHEYNRTIVNLYGQNLYTRNSLGDRDTSYDAVYDGLRDLINTCNLAGDIKTILIPYGLASDLAGGRWSIVNQMIDTLASGNTNVEIIICRLPNSKELY
jgi:O-acetyl-ADP-ribose deacetylase (regulator of RNase III)